MFLIMTGYLPIPTYSVDDFNDFLLTSSHFDFKVECVNQSLYVEWCFCIENRPFLYQRVSRPEDNVIVVAITGIVNRIVNGAHRRFCMILSPICQAQRLIELVGVIPFVVGQKRVTMSDGFI